MSRAAYEAFVRSLPFGQEILRRREEDQKALRERFPDGLPLAPCQVAYNQALAGYRAAAVEAETQERRTNRGSHVHVAAVREVDRTHRIVERAGQWCEETLRRKMTDDEWRDGFKEPASSRP